MFQLTRELNYVNRQGSRIFGEFARFKQGLKSGPEKRHLVEKMKIIPLGNMKYLEEFSIRIPFGKTDCFLSVK